MNMSLIITEVKYGAIDYDDYPCHSYYIIKISPYPYTLKADLSIDGQFISSVEMLCVGTYLFPININFHSYALQKTKSINTIVSLRKINNGNVNVICYDSRDFIPPCLQSISKNDYNIFSPIHTPIK